MYMYNIVCYFKNNEKLFGVSHNLLLPSTSNVTSDNNSVGTFTSVFFFFFSLNVYTHLSKSQET